jgi:hypothetical protein
VKKLLFLTLFLSPVALADVVMDPPEDCPAGSEGTSSHAGEWCEEQTCDADDADASCPEGTECLSTSVCLDVYEDECGGLQPDTGEPCTFEVREVLGSCETDDDCERGTCVTADRCASEEQLAAETSDSCEGCSHAQLGGSTAALFGFAGLLGLVRRRV